MKIIRENLENYFAKLIQFLLRVTKKANQSAETRLNLNSKDKHKL